MATRFYNLAADDPRRPIVEEGLSRLEARYGALLPVLAARAEPKLTQFIDLVVFVGGLRFRMPGQIDHWQKQYDDLARIHRHVERANTGAESQSDRMFGVQGDMAKRLLLGNAGSYAKVVAPGGWLIVNESPLPFLSSDSPAVHDFLHRDQLEATGFPADRISSDATPADRAFFSYCPLTPTIAFVSSPLLDPPTDSTYWRTNDPRLVLGLNELVRAHADVTLISHRQDPYGALAEQLAALDEEYARVLRERGNTGALVYTDSDRIWLSCTGIKHEAGSHPLFSRIRLHLRFADEAVNLRVGTVLREVEVYERGVTTAGLRGARVFSLDADAPLALVIEADPSLAM